MLQCFYEKSISDWTGKVNNMGIESLFHLNRYTAGTKTDRHKHDYAELLYVSD